MYELRDKVAAVLKSTIFGMRYPTESFLRHQADEVLFAVHSDPEIARALAITAAIDNSLTACTFGPSQCGCSVLKQILAKAGAEART